MTDPQYANRCYECGGGVQMMWQYRDSTSAEIAARQAGVNVPLYHQYLYNCQRPTCGLQVHYNPGTSTASMYGNPGTPDTPVLSAQWAANGRALNAQRCQAAQQRIFDHGLNLMRQQGQTPAWITPDMAGSYNRAHAPNYQGPNTIRFNPDVHGALVVVPRRS